MKPNNISEYDVRRWMIGLASLQGDTLRKKNCSGALALLRELKVKDIYSFIRAMQEAVVKS